MQIIMLKEKLLIIHKNCCIWVFETFEKIFEISALENNAKVHSKTKIALCGCFWAEIQKSHCHILNQEPPIF